MTSTDKPRRQTAIYPNVNSTNKPQKPFSRSAAKRESVLALGSIEHLQHYFTKSGIAAKNIPLNKLSNGLVPAIGGSLQIQEATDEHKLPEIDILPPSPPVPRPAFTPFVKTYETNPESLLPGVVEDLSAVARVWRLKQDVNDDHDAHDPSLLSVNPPVFDVLSVLKTTTRAIRSVRNYVVSLPDEFAGTIRANFRPSSLLPIIQKQRPRPSLNQVPNASPAPANAPTVNDPIDPLTLIRRSALDVLTVLRQLEESSRIPLTDDAYEVQSEHSSGASNSGGSSFGTPGRAASSRVTSPERDHEQDTETENAVSFSLVQVQGRETFIPVWEDDPSFDDEELDQADGTKKREHWDARLVLGSGWLYRTDVRLETLKEERAAVGRYLDIVDTVLFGGEKEGRRGWKWVGIKLKREGRGRRVSAADGEVKVIDMMRGMTVTEEPESIEDANDDTKIIIEEDDELPEWARQSAFVDNDLGRAYALLASALPPHLLLSLVPPSHSADASPTTNTAFLNSLSSGQLLCMAYNTCVRRSHRPWGYINANAIHDIALLESEGVWNDNEVCDQEREREKEKGKRGWTFRRTDNLRLWAAALKLRYLLPIQTPIPFKPSATHAYLLPSTQTPTTAASTTPSPSTTTTPAHSPNDSTRFVFPSPASRSRNPSPSRHPPSNRNSGTELPLIFDASLVARNDPAWEEMLQVVLLRWVNAVVEERRGER